MFLSKTVLPLPVVPTISVCWYSTFSGSLTLTFSSTIPPTYRFPRSTPSFGRLSISNMKSGFGLNTGDWGSIGEWAGIGVSTITPSSLILASVSNSTSIVKGVRRDVISDGGVCIVGIPAIASMSERLTLTTLARKTVEVSGLSIPIKLPMGKQYPLREDSKYSLNGTSIVIVLSSSLTLAGSTLLIKPTTLPNFPTISSAFPILFLTSLIVFSSTVAKTLYPT